MLQMIRERQGVDDKNDKMERHDLFGSLLEANDQDLDLETLSEDEIISMLLILHLLTMLT
jgi:cytochrome P450